MADIEALKIEVSFSLSSHRVIYSFSIVSDEIANLGLYWCLGIVKGDSETGA